MSRVVRVWILVVALVGLHFLLHVGFGIGSAAPDMLTLALLLAARELSMASAAGTGLMFGLLEDALSVLAFGANGVAMTVVGILGAFTRDLFVGDSWLFVISYIVLGKWLRDLIHWLMVDEGLRQSFVDQVMVQGLVGASYIAVLGLGLLFVSGLGGEA